MPKKSPSSQPAFNVVVPKHYVEVDVTKALKGMFGASGLPTPENSGIGADAERLAHYTALFQEAERLYMPSGPSIAPLNLLNQSPEARQAALKGWEYLNGRL